MCGQYDDLPLGKRRPWAARGPMLTGRRGQKSSTGRAWEPRGGVAAPACGSGLGKFPGEVGGDAPAGLCERILLTRSRDTEAFEAAQCGARAQGAGRRVRMGPGGSWLATPRPRPPPAARGQAAARGGHGADGTRKRAGTARTRPGRQWRAAGRAGRHQLGILLLARARGSRRKRAQEGEAGTEIGL